MEIRTVKRTEVALLQRFIHENWKENHILSKNQELLDYQHFNGITYNFVVAIEDNKIYCALGFIPTQQYDQDIHRFDIWLAIWCKSPDCPKGLGTQLLDWIEEALRPTTIGAIGINENIEKLYLKRGWKSGVMNHYYFANLGWNVEYEPSETFVQSWEVNPTSIPEKSQIYVNTRYRLHPFYTYRCYKMGDFSMVIRKISDNGNSFLRIVDMFGVLPVGVEYALHQLLRYEKADFIDCVNYGIHPHDFNRMGFLEKPKTMIIPNWTEPIVMEHKPIKFAYKAPSTTKTCGGETWKVDNYVIFRGNSDQDRPNIL